MSGVGKGLNDSDNFTWLDRTPYTLSTIIKDTVWQKAQIFPFGFEVKPCSLLSCQSKETSV